MISLEKAKFLLKKAIDKSNTRSEIMEHFISLIYSCGYNDGIIAHQNSQWIPCSERLPEEDGQYFVTTNQGYVQTHVFRHNGNSEEYWMRCNKAWMPLPEPYREGDTDG